MKILSINLSASGSTGMIMKGIHKEAAKNGFECLGLVPPTGDNANEQGLYTIGYPFSRKINAYLGILTGFEGCFSFFSTVKALNKIKKFCPDIIHLHNLHNNYINLPMLMKYIKKYRIRVIWTLHDCWGFTGHCPHFAYEKCSKWMTGCNKCSRYRLYPKSMYDNSKLMWKLKKKWFNNVDDLEIVTPSEWLAELVKNSYLKEYPIRVINNGIDLNVFKPIESDIRRRYGIDEEKKIVLGVAFGWSNKKGLDIFIELSKCLDKNFQVILVGTNEILDAQLPKDIISIHRTQSQAELAGIYSAANVFVNPTREEVLGLTNIEANACGVPVITFDSGGSPECIDDTSGVVVECDDIEALKREIVRICEKSPYNSQACRKRAEKFDINNMFNQYVSLYKNN